MFFLPALVTGATSIAGLGLGFMGMKESSEASKQIAEDQSKIATYEQQADRVRYAAMQTDSKRRELELIRNAQRARALAVTTATSQGAAQGSGLQGAYGQISQQANYGILGVNQQLEYGKQMFDINSNISSLRAGIANEQSKLAEGQGYSSLGNSLISIAPTFGKFFG